jgi:hypothetical protein
MNNQTPKLKSKINRMGKIQMKKVPYKELKDNNNKMP